MIDVTKETFDKFLVECGKAPLLTLEEEKSYIEQAQQGNLDAMLAICNANMRFVVSFSNAHKGDLDIISAIHIAEPGLIHAVKTYNTASDIKFIAYAAECMKECFKKNSNMLKITKTITECSTTESETENEGIMIHLPLLQIVDSPYINEDRDVCSIHDLKQISDEELQEKLSCLTNREREVMQTLIEHGGTSMSVDDVADHFELLPSRIRQIRDKALKKINR